MLLKKYIAPSSAEAFTFNGYAYIMALYMRKGYTLEAVNRMGDYMFLLKICNVVVVLLTILGYLYYLVVLMGFND